MTGSALVLETLEAPSSARGRGRGRQGKETELRVAGLM